MALPLTYRDIRSVIGRNGHELGCSLLVTLIAVMELEALLVTGVLVARRILRVTGVLVVAATGTGTASLRKILAL